ncbi:phospholipid scramblase-related protein [Frondihabitans peucedani]|uniref:Phospholipid scramblase-related protein n=1 Tax=Frondihabitans peucedani TaxID=598626 RepID=A0ABP8DXC1_9MICO
MTSRPDAGWHADPFGRFETRFWDGTGWTEHVSSRGIPSSDPPLAGAPSASGSAITSGAADGRNESAALTTSGEKSFFTEATLVVSQKAKLIEINAEYLVFDGAGSKLGSVREVGKTILGKVATATGWSSEDSQHRLLFLDREKRVMMTLIQPTTFIRSKMILRDSQGAEIGQITQKNFGLVRKARFSLEASGQRLATIQAEDRGAWDFSVKDTMNVEIARVTRTWSGLLAESFTKSDNYVVHINRSLAGPLHSLVIASALALDTLLQQGQS